MELIKRDNKANNYFDNNLIGKYIYLKRSNKDMIIHRIFKINDLLNSNPITYKVDKQYYFTVPFNQECKCFCYNGTNVIELDYREEIYSITDSEYLNMFRTFVNFDGYLSKDVSNDLKIKS